MGHFSFDELFSARVRVMKLRKQFEKSDYTTELLLGVAYIYWDKDMLRA